MIMSQSQNIPLFPKQPVAWHGILIGLLVIGTLILVEDVARLAIPSEKTTYTTQVDQAGKICLANLRAVNQDPTTRQSVDSNFQLFSTALQNCADDLKKIKAPKKIKPLHQQLVDNIELYRANVDQARQDILAAQTQKQIKRANVFLAKQHKSYLERASSISAAIDAAFED